MDPPVFETAPTGSSYTAEWVAAITSKPTDAVKAEYAIQTLNYLRGAKNARGFLFEKEQGLSGEPLSDDAKDGLITNFVDNLCTSYLPNSMWKDAIGTILFAFNSFSNDYVNQIEAKKIADQEDEQNRMEEQARLAQEAAQRATEEAEQKEKDDDKRRDEERVNAGWVQMNVDDQEPITYWSTENGLKVKGSFKFTWADTEYEFEASAVKVRKKRNLTTDKDVDKDTSFENEDAAEEEAGNEDAD
jgi:hypothetical protein